MREINAVETIRELIHEDRYIITLHAKSRMDQRGISTEDIITLIMNGEIIENYTDSKPCPSALIMGTVAGCYCHAVVALCRNHLRIITVYWPGEDEWIDARKRKSN